MAWLKGFLSGGEGNGGYEKIGGGFWILICNGMSWLWGKMGKCVIGMR